MHNCLNNLSFHFIVVSTIWYFHKWKLLFSAELSRYKSTTCEFSSRYKIWNIANQELSHIQRFSFKIVVAALFFPPKKKPSDWLEKYWCRIYMDMSQNVVSVFGSKMAPLRGKTDTSFWDIPIWRNYLWGQNYSKLNSYIHMWKLLVRLKLNHNTYMWKSLVMLKPKNNTYMWILLVILKPHNNTYSWKLLVRFKLNNDTYMWK